MSEEKELGRVGVEIGVDTDQKVLVLNVTDMEEGRQIQLAMTPEQAYAMAVGLIGAIKVLSPSQPMAGQGGETLH